MNIWYVSTYDTPEGESSRTHDYAMALAARGHQVTFLTSSFNHFTRRERLRPGERWREEAFGDVRVIWTRTTAYYDNRWGRARNMASAAWSALRVGARLCGRPDVVVGPSVPLTTGLAAYLLARLKGACFVFEVRDIWPQALIDLGILRERSPLVWGLERIEAFLYRRARRIVAVLPFAYGHICRYGIPRNNIVWVPNAVRLARYEACRPYDGGSRDRLHVMYLGSFATTQSVETIIEAAALLRTRPEGKAVRFTIVGGGDAAKSLMEQIASHGLDNVAVTGFVPKDEIPLLFKGADVLVASVKDTPVYQFGINSNKLLDYFGSGRPIIFAGRTANDPVAEAQAGFSIPPEDPQAMCEAIVQMHQMGPAERRRLGDNGLAYGEATLELSKLAGRLEEVFADACDNRVAAVASRSQ
jgi:glycosyltransferase involved in cell wall biosynthesis